MTRRKSSSQSVLNVLMALVLLVSLIAAAVPAMAAPQAPNTPNDVTKWHVAAFKYMPKAMDAAGAPLDPSFQQAPYWWLHKGSKLTISNIDTNGDGPGWIVFNLGHTIELARQQVTYPLKNFSVTLIMPDVPDDVYDLEAQLWTDQQAATRAFKYIWGRTDIANGKGGAVVMDSTAPIVKPNALIFPNGGEDLLVGAKLKIRWNASMDLINKSIWDPDVPNFGQDLSPYPITVFWSSDGGENWFQISGPLANNGLYNTHVFGPPCPASDPSCLVKIVVTDRAGNTAEDMSNAPFSTRVLDTTPPMLSMVAPVDHDKIKGDQYMVKAFADDQESGINDVKFSWAFDDRFAWHVIGTTRWPADDMAGPPFTFAVPFDTTEIKDGKKIMVQAEAVNGAGANAFAVVEDVLVDNSAPVVKLLEPSDGDFVRNTVEIDYKAADPHSGIVAHKVLVSLDGGQTWTDLGSGAWDPDDKYFTVEWDTVAAGIREATAMIKVMAKNGVGLTTTTDPITVHVDNVPPEMFATTLKFPNGGEFFNIGDQVDILWQAVDIVDADALLDKPISLFLSWNGCAAADDDWHLIAGQLPNTGSYHWTVASKPTDMACVKLVAEDKAGNTSFDTSDKVFTIGGSDFTLPQVTWTMPANGDWVSGKIVLKADAQDPESMIDHVEFWCNLDQNDPDGWKKIDGNVANPPFELVKSHRWNTTMCGMAPVPDGATVWLIARAFNGVGGHTDARIKVKVDNTPADVEVTKPPLFFTWPTGFPPALSGDYELEAMASDSAAPVTKVEFYFQYLWSQGDPEKVGEATAPATDSLYRFVLNTRALDDGCGIVTAKVYNAASGNSADLVGEEQHWDHAICFKNTADIGLLRGWNLISLPLIPDDPAIEVVLADLIDDGTVDAVATYARPANVWQMWAPGAPSDLSEMKDGVGYWIKMAEDDDLDIHGVQLPGAGGVPPEYQVFQDWNLIGFKSINPRTVEDYLGLQLWLQFGQMYRFQAVPGSSGYYVPVDASGMMLPKFGYWLATNQDGTIHP